MHGGDLPTEPLVSSSSACPRRLPRRPRNSCAGQLQILYCTYRSTLCNWGRSTHEINGIGRGPFHGQPHDPARLIPTLARMARALKEQQLHRSLSARVPRGTSTSHPSSPRWGNSTVGLVGVGDNDEAALISPWAAREGKLALGLTGRHRSRLEAAEVTSQLLKMEHAGGHPLADRRSGTNRQPSSKHGLAQWPTTCNSQIQAFPRDMPGRWDDEREGGGGHESSRRISRSPVRALARAKRSGPHNPSLISPSLFAWAARAVAYLPVRQSVARRCNIQDGQGPLARKGVPLAGGFGGTNPLWL